MDFLASKGLILAEGNLRRAIRETIVFSDLRPVSIA